MPIRSSAPILAASFAVLTLLSCREQDQGPVVIAAIGGPPQIANPNLQPLSPASAILLEGVAQGLVRFDATGQIEPALAQSWIVSDDGLRFTFRLSSAQWQDGSDVTAEQVVERLRAAFSNASRNPLKPVLGAIDEIEAMTDDVLEISLVAARPNFLQLLAQPELAILRGGAGTGPYRPTTGVDGAMLLSLPAPDTEDDAPPEAAVPALAIRGDDAARAVARFVRGEVDYVTGGTIGDIFVARAADPPADARRVDPVAGLLGLQFTGRGGRWADPAARAALAMAIDRASLVESLAVLDLQPRESLVPTGIEELPNPALPAWFLIPVADRRTEAARTIAAVESGAALTIRVAAPEGRGYDLILAHLRRDWRAIGVALERVSPQDDADLRLIDRVAPASLAPWYLRRFICEASRICSAEADAALAAARAAPDPAERSRQLALADRAITDLSVFIPITAPVRWSLISPRLTGFQLNPFARRFPGSLIAERR